LAGKQNTEAGRHDAFGRSWRRTKGERLGADNTIPLVAVTVNYRCADLVAALVESVAAIPGMRAMAVVDHSGELRGSTFDAPFPVKVLVRENTGYGDGVNAGLDELRPTGDIALVLYPDVRFPDPGAVQEAARFLVDNPSVGCLAPLTFATPTELFFSCRRFYTVPTLLASRIPPLRALAAKTMHMHEYRDAPLDRPVQVDWASGGAMLFRGALFPDVFHFDERYFLYFEDVDVCASLWRAGYSVVRYPGLKVLHEAGLRSRTNARHLLWHLTSCARFMLKFGGLPRRRRLVGK
jgi:GT2 family glycosyltransferase